MFEDIKNEKKISFPSRLPSVCWMNLISFGKTGNKKWKNRNEIYYIAIKANENDFSFFSSKRERKTFSFRKQTTSITISNQYHIDKPSLELDGDQDIE